MGTRRDHVASNEVCLEHLFCRLLREIADVRPTWPDTVQQLVEYMEIRISKRDPFSGIIGRHTRLGLPFRPCERACPHSPCVQRSLTACKRTRPVTNHALETVCRFRFPGMAYAGLYPSRSADPHRCLHENHHGRDYRIE